jgi:hypothetical protein
MSQASQEPRFGYTLVVGPDDADRQAILSSLHEVGLELAAGTEAEILADQDWVPPTLVILNDSGTREERLATQTRLARHPPLVGVPLLIVAHAADIDSFTGSITHGAAAYLVKPVPAGELEKVARRLSGWKGIGDRDRTERRRRVRRPLILRVTVDIRARKRKVPGQVVDASGGGCRLELSEELQLNEPVRIILHGHEQTTHVALGAEVRWDLPEGSGTHLAGVRFTGTTAMLAGKLLGFASSGLT